jgi:hypothetical protein
VHPLQALFFWQAGKPNADAQPWRPELTDDLLVFASGRAVLDAASLDGTTVLRARAANWARPVAITTTAVGISSR